MKLNFSDLVDSQEFSKFARLAILMFFILLVSSLLRGLKDSIIVPLINAEIIQFIKLFAVFPSALIFSLIYSKLINRYPYHRVFYIITGFSIALLAVDIFILIPNRNLFELDLIRSLELQASMAQYKWLFIIASNWTLILMYVIAELWVNIIYSLLFWQFVNQLSSKEAAKNYYVVMTCVGYLGIFFAGKVLQKITILAELTQGNYCPHLPYKVVLLYFIFGFSLAIILLTLYLYKQIFLKFGKSEIIHRNLAPQTLRTSIRLVVASPVIMLLSLMLISYGVCTGIAEGLWRYKLSQVYHRTEDYAHFMGSYLELLAITNIFFALIAQYLVRKLRWVTIALISPLCFLTVGGGLFISDLVIEHPENVTILGFSFTLFLAHLATAQVVLTKASKYSFFEPTKEMVYIPLSYELKTKGKAAADVVGNQFGKTLGAGLQVILLSLLSNYHAATPYLAVIFLGLSLVWVWAILRLNKYLGSPR